MIDKIRKKKKTFGRENVEEKNFLGQKSFFEKINRKKCFSSKIILI